MDNLETGIRALIDAESLRHEKLYQAGYEAGYQKGRIDAIAELEGPHWILNVVQGTCKCSECGNICNSIKNRTPFCPYCGAKMSKRYE